MPNYAAKGRKADYVVIRELSFLINIEDYIISAASKRRFDLMMRTRYLNIFIQTKCNRFPSNDEESRLTRAAVNSCANQIIASAVLRDGYKKTSKDDDLRRSFLMFRVYSRFAKQLQFGVVITYKEMTFNNFVTMIHTINAKVNVSVN